MAHLGFVRPIGEQIDPGLAGSVGAPAEMMVVIEIDVVTFLWKASGGLSVHTEQHVVVKFPIVINRAARPGESARSSGVAGEPVKHRQKRLNAGIR